MARSLNDIEQVLLDLPEAERARLVHRLIVSLDADLPQDEGVGTAWLKVAQRRDAEIECGEVQTIPADEVMRRAHKALNRKK